MSDNRYRCRTCGGSHIQVCVPAWFREDQNLNLHFIEAVEDADVTLHYCEDCRDCVEVRDTLNPDHQQP